MSWAAQDDHCDDGSVAIEVANFNLFKLSEFRVLI
jgi:hypothetical protein